MEDITKTLEIPVIFYDGEKEIDLGKVQIIPLMTFKILQSTLSNKIGISPNHITIYLDRNANNNFNNHQHHHHHRRRHPVTSKFDFSALREGGCIFWVVLKRGRRNRRRHNGKNDVVKSGPVLILPRGVGVGAGFGLSEFENWEYLEYVNRLRMIDQMEREKERYLMSLNLNSNVYNELSGYNNNNNNQQQQHYPNYDYNHHNYKKSSSSNYSDDYYNYDGVDVDMASCSSSTGGASSSETTTTRVYCDVCYNSSSTGGDDAETVPFHWCKNDVVVTTKTRSRVGPIAPPLKNSLCA